MSTGLFLLFSIGILGGIISSFILRRAGAPQVLAYILAGLVLGQSGLKIIELSDIQALEPFNVFALAIIGLMVGSEIRIADFRRYGKQFFTILMGEGLGAFISVTLVLGFVLFMVSGSISVAVAGGLIMGAISAATDPASTMSVLWEKRAAGVLTTTIIAVIALDDALALLLYGICSGIAQIAALGTEASLQQETIRIIVELFGSTAAGTVFGLIIGRLLLKSEGTEQGITASFGLFLLSIGLSIVTGLDVIIVALISGVIVTNRHPYSSEHFFSFMRSIANPVYVLFFVMTGARLTLGSMPGWLWLIVALYILVRSLGKISGAYLGAKLSSASRVVRRFVGLGLFSQGGISIGLSIVAGQRLQNIDVNTALSLGSVITLTITTTTFIIQLVGPAATSLAVKFSKEAGVSITIEDLIKSRTVADMLQPLDTKKVLYESTTITEAVNLFSTVNSDLLPVVDKNFQLIGMVTFNDIRQILANYSLWSWSLVSDIMNQNIPILNRDQGINEALNLSHATGYTQIPVVENSQLISLIDLRKVESDLKIEVLKKQEAAFSA